MGFVCIADGFLDAAFGSDYRRLYQTRRFGSHYAKAWDFWINLPKSKMRVVGFAEMLPGAVILLLVPDLEQAKRVE